MLAVAGFGALASTMHRHARQTGTRAPPSRWLRWAGWLMLCVSLAIMVLRADWRMATVAWIGQAVLAAALCMVVLTLRPMIWRPMCLMAVLIGLFAVYSRWAANGPIRHNMVQSQVIE